MTSLKYIIISIGYVILVLAVSAPSQAAHRKAGSISPQKIDLRYDVYAGGLKVLNAELALDLNRRAYDMEVKAQTQGFIGSLFPWKGDYATSGRAGEKGLVPNLHTATSAWRDTKNTTEMSYDPAGRLTRTTTQEKGKTTVNRDIDRTLSKDAVDMLTGALKVLQNARSTEKCKGAYPVFDGKRRFDITLKDAGKEMLHGNRYSAFSGEALKCTVEVRPVAGFTEKDQKRGWMAVQNHTEARKKLPTLWLARLDDKGPLVPVRMEIASEYGSVVAHLTGTAAK